MKLRGASCVRCSSVWLDLEETTMQFTHEHEEIQRTLKRYIDDHINPHRPTGLVGTYCSIGISANRRV